MHRTKSFLRNPFLHPWRLRLAQQIILSGGLIAYPTEAVFGLGCHPLNEDAVFRLLRLKNRPWQKGLILISDQFERLLPYLESLPPDTLETILDSWPGPATWLVPAAPQTPDWLTGRHTTLAVRVTAHPVAAALCRVAETPLVSTSANPSQCPPARAPLEVRLRCGHGIDLIMHGATGGMQRPTQIRNALSGDLVRE
jgi:L-threonylcarbamoyladenylate synthase